MPPDSLAPTKASDRQSMLEKSDFGVMVASRVSVDLALS
jgi:hypothetical protein